MKTIKLMAAAWLLSATALLISCGEKTAPEPVSELIDFQSYKGSVRKSIYYNPEGDEVRTTIDTIFYNYQENINGEVWYGSQGGLQFIRNSSEGVMAFFKPLNESYLLYKYPAKTGEYYTTKSYQGASYNNEDGNPYNTTAYQMLVANTEASYSMQFISQQYQNLMHYKKETITPATNTPISPAEWYVLPGKGTVVFIAYYDEEFKKVSVYSETISFF